MPHTSTIVPYSDVFGAQSRSRTKALWWDSARLFGHAYLVAARLVAARVDDAQGLVLEERPYARETLVVRQRPQVCRLRVAEKLKPLPREMLEEPSEREPGPVDHGLVDLARKSVAADDNRKAKPLRAGFQKVGEGDLRDSGAP